MVFTTSSGAMGYSPTPTFATMPAKATSPRATITKTDLKSMRKEKGRRLPLTVASPLHLFLLAPITA